MHFLEAGEAAAGEGRLTGLVEAKDVRARSVASITGNLHRRGELLRHLRQAR